MRSGIFGWSLPPGVTTSMLPGNSPADEEAEAFADSVYEMLGGMPDDALAEKVIAWGEKLRSDAYAEGYSQGQSDEAEARRAAEESAEPGDNCSGPNGHEWAYTGTEYGGDDPSYRGEGRCYCIHCGADGDA